jgi:hypothetical protein
MISLLIVLEIPAFDVEDSAPDTPAGGMSGSDDIAPPNIALPLSGKRLSKESADAGFELGG